MLIFYPNKCLQQYFTIHAKTSKTRKKADHHSENGMLMHYSIHNKRTCRQLQQRTKTSQHKHEIFQKSFRRRLNHPTALNKFADTTYIFRIQTEARAPHTIAAGSY